jgi:hypothetical protein
MRNSGSGSGIQNSRTGSGINYPGYATLVGMYSYIRSGRMYVYSSVGWSALCQWLVYERKAERENDGTATPSWFEIHPTMNWDTFWSGPNQPVHIFWPNKNFHLVKKECYCVRSRCKLLYIRNDRETFFRSFWALNGTFLTAAFILSA